MVYVVNSVLASGVDMLLEKDLVGFAHQKMKIHPLMLLTLSMIFQTFSPTLHNPSTRHTRASYMEMILTMAANISIHTPDPSRRFNSFYDDDDYEESTIPLNEIVSQIPPSTAIIPILPIMEPEDSLIMGNEELGTIPKKKSDEFIKSSVEDLVLIPSESEDTSGSDSECDLPSCNDFSPINVSEEKYVTSSYPLFNSNDDFTSSDDESLSDEDVPEDNAKIYSNPLFEFDDEYISSNPALLVTPLSDANEDECFDPGGKINEIDAFLDMDISMDIENDYHDSEGDIIYLESLLINDTIPNLPPKVFLDHDPENLKDEPDNDKLKSMVKDCPDFEDSHAHGFVHHPLDLQSLACFYMVMDISKTDKSDAKKDKTQAQDWKSTRNRSRRRIHP
ncbi:hypothetical protein Tco_0826574 [Tanacetum coccineum]